MTAAHVLASFGVVAGAAVLVWGTAEALARLTRTTLWRALAVGLAVFAVLLWVRPASLVLGNAAGLAAAALAGAGLGRKLRDRSEVIAFAVAMAIADIVSVYFGLAGDLAASADRGAGSLLAWLTVSVPMAGRVVAVVGLGDLLVLGYFFTVLRHNDAPPAARFLVPTGGLLAALAFGLATPGPAPGLPFIAAAVVAYLLITAPRTGPEP